MHPDDVMSRARADLYARALPTSESVSYVREQKINVRKVIDFIGAFAVTSIADCGAGRFDFIAGDQEEAVQAFVCEVLGQDGETSIDLVAWPTDQPDHVLSMFGRAPFLGLWEICNPGSYYLDRRVDIHRTPLEWMQADCRGAAVVVPHRAGHLLLKIPGKVAARDMAHLREINKLIRMAIDPRDRVVVAPTGEAAA